MSFTVIRPGGVADLPYVAALWQRLQAYHQQVGMQFPLPADAHQQWLASFERTLGRFSFLWVAEQDAQVLAFLLARLKRSPAYFGGQIVGEISDLYVDESLRSQGVAAHLVRLAMDQFEALQVHSVEVQVMAQNEGGRRFWLNQGFTLELVQVRKNMEEHHA